MSSDIGDTPLPRPKRRRFRIQSDFGRARQWRSRKSRPCDACRRRKTACVIDTAPPCGYCRSKGIECRATAAHPPQPVVPSPAPEEESLPSVDILSDTTDSIALPLPVAAHVPASSAGVASPQDELQVASPPIPWASVPRPEADLSKTYAAPTATSPDASSITAASFIRDRRESVVAGLTAVTPARASLQGTAPTPVVATAAIGTSDLNATITLEDNPGRTPHVMGLAAEQDAELLVSFRSAVRNEVNRVDADIVQVYGGDVRAGRPPVHFSLLHDEFAPTDNAAKQAASERIEAAVHGFADDLVRLYFRHVHPVYPLLAKRRFLQAYTSDKTSLPASLRGVVYGLAANFWKRQRPQSASAATPPALASPLDHHQLFEDALASLQRELHGPDLWTLQASLLLLHENSAENATMETPRLWALTAQAVACGQMNGLHRDPALWSLPDWEKQLRRRLWWAAVSADTWSAICHGNPPHVYGSSFTTADLALEDVAADEDLPADLQHFLDGGSADDDDNRESDNRHVLAEDRSSVGYHDIAACARFATLVSLSRIVHELLLSSFSDVVYTESMKDLVARETMILGFRQKLRNWASLLPRCLDMDAAQKTGSKAENNAPVHLAFYAAIALTYRTLMSPVTKAAKQDPGSRLRRYFAAAVAEFSPFVDFMHGISVENLHAFWGVHARSQLIVCGNFLIYLFLLAPSTAEIQESFQILSRFHDSLQRLSAMADHVAIDLLRPVALRIDTFFTQSAQATHAGNNASHGLS